MLLPQGARSDESWVFGVRFVVSILLLLRDRTDVVEGFQSIHFWSKFSYTSTFVLELYRSVSAQCSRDLHFIHSLTSVVIAGARTQYSEATAVSAPIFALFFCLPACLPAYLPLFLNFFLSFHLRAS